MFLSEYLTGKNAMLVAHFRPRNTSIRILVSLIPGIKTMVFIIARLVWRILHYVNAVKNRFSKAVSVSVEM